VYEPGELKTRAYPEGMKVEPYVKADDIDAEDATNSSVKIKQSLRGRVLTPTASSKMNGGVTPFRKKNQEQELNHISC